MDRRIAREGLVYEASTRFEAKGLGGFLIMRPPPPRPGVTARRQTKTVYHRLLWLGGGVGGVTCDTALCAVRKVNVQTLMN